MSTESRKQFEVWFKENKPFYQWNENLWTVWQYQQQRIDELEKKLDIAVNALKDIEDVIGSIQAEKAYSALKQIGVNL